MGKNGHMKSFHGLFAAAVLLASVWGARCFADLNLYSGTLTWTEGTVTAYDGWTSDATSFSWSIERTQVDGVATGPWHYSYTFTAPSGAHALSHLIIEASGPDSPIGAFSTSNPMDFINTAGYSLDSVLVGLYEGSDDAKPNPYMPADMYGIKFEDMFGTYVPVTINGVEAQSWTVTFDSWRNPMWGDFYAVNGKGDDVDKWAAAYNALPSEIGVPDGSYVPAPAAVLLGMLGLGFAGLKLRKLV